MQIFDRCVEKILLLLCLCLAGSKADANLQDRYLGINYAITGSNGIVTNDMSSTTLEYQHAVGFLTMFHTHAPYKWYFDAALTASYYELEDPIGNLGITGTPATTADLKAANYILEVGFSRRQTLNSFMQWELGARLGGFGLKTSTLSGQTASAQYFNVESSASMGLTISTHSGITWEITENYTVDTSFLLRKHYLSQFTVRDTISGVEFKYPDFVSFGFSIGISRGF